MPYTYILLDSDETIMDFQAAQRHALSSALAQYGWPYDKDIHDIYEQINQRAWKEFERGEITKEQLRILRFQRFFKRMGWQEKAKELGYGEFHKVYMGYLGECADLLPGALEFVRDMSREGRIYILTNGFLETQRNRFGISPVTKYISGIFVSEETGFQKPQKEYFDYVFSHIEGFEKKKAIMVGDSLSSDIKGANQAGVKACWYNPRRAVNDGTASADYEVQNYDELRAVIRGEI